MPVIKIDAYALAAGEWAHYIVVEPLAISKDVAPDDRAVLRDGEWRVYFSDMDEARATVGNEETVALKPHPNLRSFMDLSTAHLSLSTREWLERCAIEDNYSHWVASTPYGFFTYCDEENAEDSIPADAFACMTYARQHGADYILFDRDADQLTDLPTFEE